MGGITPCLYAEEEVRAMQGQGVRRAIHRGLASLRIKTEPVTASQKLDRQRMPEVTWAQ